MQLWLAASVGPQVPGETTKALLALNPASVMACVFGLFTVMVCAGLVVPTVIAAKLITFGVACGGTSGTGAPAPVRLLVALPCGVAAVKLPAALPNVAVVKVMLITQLPPAERLAPQVLVWAKPGVEVIALTVMATLFGLVSVAVCGRLGCPIMIEPKLMALGLKVGGNSGAAAVPLSAELTLPAEVVAVTLPLAAPTTVGVNVTVMVHDALAASVAAQVLVWVKPAPPIDTAVVIACAFGLLSVSTRGGTAVPTVAVPGKASGCGAKTGGTSGGAVAVPLTVACAACAALPLR